MQDSEQQKPQGGRNEAKQSSSRSKGGSAKASWQLDPHAGVHHMSDRVVNGPRKQVEAYAARFREGEVIRCVGSGHGSGAPGHVGRSR